MSLATPMKIEVSGQTHVGMKRNHNEDNLLLLPEERLFVVADGMGGHSSGEVASKIAVEEVAEFFRMTSQDHEITWPYKMDKQKNYDENRLATGVKLAPPCTLMPETLSVSPLSTSLSFCSTL